MSCKKWRPDYKALFLAWGLFLLAVWLINIFAK